MANRGQLPKTDFGSFALTQAEPIRDAAADTQEEKGEEKEEEKADVVLTASEAVQGTQTALLDGIPVAVRAA